MPTPKQIFARLVFALCWAVMLAVFVGVAIVAGWEAIVSALAGVAFLALIIGFICVFIWASDNT